MARKKGNGKYALVGGLIAIVVLAVLLLEPEDIGNLTQLSSDDDLTFQVPTPASLLPDDPNFQQVPSGTTSAHFADCKLKHTTTVFDINGDVAQDPIQSSGLQGSPVLVPASLIADNGVQVASYQVEFKILCSMLDGFNHDLIIEPSRMSLQVQAQILSGLNTAYSSTFTTKEVKFNESIPREEKTIATVSIPASAITNNLVDRDLPTRLHIHTFGNVQLSLPVADTDYVFPVQFGQITSSFDQSIQQDNPDRDGDGIQDSADTCPDTAETYNGFQDTDGCPDSSPDITQVDTGGGTIVPITEQLCHGGGNTWYIDSSGQGICSSPRTINGVHCFTVDFRETDKLCVNPEIFVSGQEPTSTGGTTTPTSTSSGGFTREQIESDLLEGDVVTTITYTFTDGTKQTVTGNKITTSAGVVTTASVLGSVTNMDSAKGIKLIEVETFYVRDSLSDVNEIKLTDSGITHKGILNIAGQNVDIPTGLTTGTDVGSTGKTISTGQHGFSLGKRFITPSDIQSVADDFLPTKGQRTASLSIVSEGIFVVERDGTTGRASITGEVNELTELIVTTQDTIDSAPCEDVGLVTVINDNGEKACVEPKIGEPTVLVCEFKNAEIQERPCDETFRINWCGSATNTKDCDVPPELKPSEDPQDDCNDNLLSGILGVCDQSDNPTGDKDGDGLPDIVDECPTQSATTTNGCPLGATPTNDGDKDGVIDANDQCPDQKETYNGFQDSDGCPDTIKGNNQGGTFCVDNPNDPRCKTPELPNILNDPTFQLALGIIIIIIAVVIIIARRRSSY